MKIGFIGVGNMGRPMAENLLKAGYEVNVYDLAKEPVEEMKKQGANACETNRELAAQSDVIFTSLPNGKIVESVMAGSNGVIDACKEGSIIIDMSSVAPSTTEQMAKIAAAKKVSYVDAPVSGGTAGAKAGTLTIMVGADEETYAKIKPVLEVVGKNIYPMGKTGLGDAMKIVNNLLLGCNMAVLAEALVLGVKCGLTPEAMKEIISVSSGRSYALDAKMEKFVMNDQFEGGFALALQHKDLGLALEAGKDVASPPPITGLASQIFEFGIAKGLSREDMSAVIKVYEDMTGVKVRKTK
ncbi:MAG: NAD(P)-dependent oxidoreductase [Lachnospiraceae bacterium]|nr:NAD(P)-dependent oxidoreductase [Lachnospiraceae bacterium]